MRITIIGHNTVLIEVDGIKILTDPWFGLGGNPIFARLAPPAHPRQELTDVHLVLVSHDHWDHTDGQYLRLLAEDVPVVVPNQTSWLIRLSGAKNVIGVGAWQSLRFREITVTAVPAFHITFTVGFVIQSKGKQIYFAGDTYYGPFMQQIGQRFQLNAALIPVTTFRIPMTMGEKGAVRAVQALKPSTVIPVHLGLRPRLPWLRTNHTPEGFMKRLQEAGIGTPVIILREGESWTG
jgi:L-ascorbate metabolism protein UlaG (beta-lactamase superfamily)